MGKWFKQLDQNLIQFIDKQAMFFVSTAPSDGGRINLSPKGYSSLKVVHATCLAYIDCAGSGNETAHHLIDNQRITLMWCSFEKEPLILRVYAYGKVISKGSEAYYEWIQAAFPDVSPESARQIFVLDIEGVQTSCGFGVPLMEFKEERDTLGQWTKNKVEKNQLDDYILKHGARLDDKIPIQKTVEL